MSNRCVSVDVVENTRAHSLLLKAGIGECAPGEITLGRVWGLTGMRVDENIYLGRGKSSKNHHRRHQRTRRVGSQAVWDEARA
jgi:hypothetical protein